MSDRIIMGISACLLGRNVRYDGSNKLDAYLVHTLGQFVTWIPVCPETECGLSVPRDPMQLMGVPDHPRLVVKDSGADHTEQMNHWISSKLPELKKNDLSAFIFKSKSPSCGVNAIKIYDATLACSQETSGMFAQAFKKHFPLIPIADDSQLYELQERDHFFERIFINARWRELESSPKKKDLVAFHTEHKLLLMSHSPRHLKQLGALVSNMKISRQDTLYSRYEKILMEALAIRATVERNVNVLQHSIGYLRNHLNSDEKRDLLHCMAHYSDGTVPLLVPIVLFGHFIRKYKEPYLQTQVYFNPHPFELDLRNHA